MKPINAYLKVKDFSLRIEKINTSLRLDTGIEQLKSAKDFMVSIETLDVANALTCLAQFFEKESVVAEAEHIKEMFEAWSTLLSMRQDALQTIIPNFGLLKMAIDLDKIHFESKEGDHQKVKDSLIKGVMLFTEDFQCLQGVVIIFDQFIIPKMTAHELQPEMESISLN